MPIRKQTNTQSSHLFFLQHQLTRSGEGIRFGTDGWRAVIGDQFNFHNLQLIGQAVSDYLHGNYPGDISVAIGYDTRFLSRQFARTLASVLAANRIRVLLTRRYIPTPVLSYTVNLRQLTAGIMLTASHNPYYYHGLKFKGRFGGPVSAEVTGRIESYLSHSPVRMPGPETGSFIEEEDFFSSYREHILGLVDPHKISGIQRTVVISAMHGAASKYLSSILRRLHPDVGRVDDTPDPYFGGLPPEPVIQNLERLRRRVTATHAVAGLATDGDADRIGVIDDRGRFVALHELMALLYRHCTHTRGWQGQVVRSTSMADTVDVLAAGRTPVVEVPVGFKHISEEMRKTAAVIAGEESGGFGYSVHIPERDGLLTALLILEMLGDSGETLTGLLGDLRKQTGRRSYDRIDVTHETRSLRSNMAALRKDPPARLNDQAVLRCDLKDGIKFYLESGAWVLLRVSDTEPMGRIYVTAPDMQTVRKLLKAGRELLVK